ncbi:MAG: glutathione S-transferase family protein [Rhodospirillaceae bacterium]
MSAITLYNFPQSTCSQKVRLTLWEKGIPYDDHIVDHAGREHLGEAYLRLNPNGVVPTITHGEAVIVDSSVIMEYLDEVFPDRPMSPSDPIGRAHMRKWLRYLEEVPTPAIRVPSFNRFLSQRYRTMGDKQYAEMADRHPLRKHFYRRMNKVGFGAEETAESLERLDQAAQRFSDALSAHGKEWIMGDDITIADAAYLPTVDRMIDLGLGDTIRDRPALAAWYERYAARDAFRKTFYKGTRLTDIFSDAV